MREERKRKEAENQKKKEIHPLPFRDIASANPVLRRADTNPACKFFYALSFFIKLGLYYSKLLNLY